ncbi:MAG TPA: glycosyltransferase [Gammaproteobacteria bacterium]|nr:glycosyltransferase [Gammaproteobacteria bacterium]
MRIAIFTDNFYPEIGGIQDSIRTTVRELSTRGHEIMVFAPAAAERDYRRANLPVGEPEFGANVTVRRLFSMPILSSSQQSRIVIPIGQCWHDFAAFQPDIVHTHSFLGVGLEGLCAARRFGVPVVGTNHWAMRAFDMYVPLARRAFRHVSSKAVVRYYQCCNYVTGPSHFTIADMRVSGLTRPCKVISNPIDTRIFHRISGTKKQRLKARLGLGAATVIYAGRLAPEKRIDLLLNAIARACLSIPDISLVVAGHGSSREKLTALAHELGINQRVYFVGTLPHIELAELFSASDLFAIASTSETQSMVLLQAMACGLPATGVHSGGLPEHIPAATGLLSEPGNVTDLSTNFVRILTSQPLREKMGRQANRFASKFSVSSIADAWEDVYKFLVHKHSTDSVPSEPAPQFTQGINHALEHHHTGF